MIEKERDEAIYHIQSLESALDSLGRELSELKDKHYESVQTLNAMKFLEKLVPGEGISLATSRMSDRTHLLLNQIEGLEGDCKVLRSGIKKLSELYDIEYVEESEDSLF